MMHQPRYTQRLRLPVLLCLSRVAHISRALRCVRMTDRQGALTPGLPEHGPLSLAGERGKGFGSAARPLAATKHDVGSCSAARSERGAPA
jgi:hypothetical protein